MNLYKNILTNILALTFVLYIHTINVYSATFNDVKEDSFAYDYIENTAKLGLLVGNLSGNFNPNSPISKFDIIKIIAKLDGYNQNTNNDIEKQYYKSLNEKYKSNISIYENKFSKWDISSSYEIAYLLENEILKLKELDDFIVLNNNKEQLRAISKEELSLYLVRVMRLEESVNKMSFQTKFKDNEDISKDKLNSVYYLSSLNIIQPDDFGKINPKNAVLKAELAAILTKFLDYTNIDVQFNNHKSNTDETDIYTKFGIIEKTYPLEKIIQTRIGYNTNIYKLEEDATIKINGKDFTLDMLPEGSYAEITFNNSLISNININTKIKYKNIEEKKSDNEQVFGVIKSINKDNIAIGYIPSDHEKSNVKEIIEIIPFSSNYKVYRENKFSYLNEIFVGDIATITLSDNMALEIYLKDKNSIFLGNIIEKSSDEKYLKIKTIDNKILNIELSNNYKIFKNKIQKNNLDTLKVGDEVTVTTNNNKITNINATSKVSEKIGTVYSIKIYPDYAVLTLKDDEKPNDFKEYYVDTKKINIYFIKVLDKVKLKLESDEVDEISLMNN